MPFIFYGSEGKISIQIKQYQGQDYDEGDLLMDDWGFGEDYFWLLFS